ncbi:hypothetical protein [Vibrio rarus]|uniref:hypothetical protein n=1 Tax=Vibrio rarus TaxID=413403 RepID=UPI0021C446DF|nr:hypothetical protein [Vibrio rarus]
MKKLLILLFCLFSLSLLLAVASLVGLLGYKDKGYDWEWLGFPLLDSGVQIARTTDTHQLLLRKLYPLKSLEVSVYTTMNNKLLLHISRFEPCEGVMEGQLQLNNQQSKAIRFHCANKEEWTFSVVTVHLEKAVVVFDSDLLAINFAEWNLADIQKDQFKQLHSDYYNQIGDPSKYQWSRD